jgi:hypothetical protein
MAGNVGGQQTRDRAANTGIELLRLNLSPFNLAAATDRSSDIPRRKPENTNHWRLSRLRWNDQQRFISPLKGDPLWKIFSMSMRRLTRWPVG